MRSCCAVRRAVSRDAYEKVSRAAPAAPTVHITEGLTMFSHDRERDYFPSRRALAAAGGVVLIATVLLGGCDLSGEPTDSHLREIFQQHRGTLDELRRMMEEDEKKHKLLSVYLSPDYQGHRSFCVERQVNCIPSDRWQAYADRLRRTGVTQINAQETLGVYFQIHSKSPPGFGWNGPFRYRGLVYAPGRPRVIHRYDDTEERVDLGGGWYSYLIVDD